MGTQLRANEIVLFATNTGAWYEVHKRMARDGASRQKWFEHVTGTVVPRYRREFHEHVLSWPSERFDAAGELKRYYENHVREIDEADCGMQRYRVTIRGSKTGSIGSKYCEMRVYEIEAGADHVNMRAIEEAHRDDLEHVLVVSKQLIAE